MTNPLQRLSQLGQSPWLDQISAALLVGELSRLVQAGEVLGVTSNPSIFEKAVGESPDYDRRIAQMAQRGLPIEEIYDALTTQDVTKACDLLRGVYRASGGRDGYVSLEVNPHYANDARQQYEEAVRLSQKVNRPNLLIKVPATPQGLEAVKELSAQGVKVNITLIFSQAHYQGAARAYVQGLEERLKGGLDLSGVTSVASVFISRIDTAVDRKLDSLGGGEAQALRGRAAVAHVKVIYQAYQEFFSSPHFRELGKKGANIQRLVWGSTSTKDPKYSDIKYVQELIGPATVNTMPLSTLEAFRDHGQARLTLGEGVEEAKKDLERLARLGIDLDRVCAQLQEEGVAAFARSFDSLLATLASKRKALLAGRP